MIKYCCELQCLVFKKRNKNKIMQLILKYIHTHIYMYLLIHIKITSGEFRNDKDMTVT